MCCADSGDRKKGDGSDKTLTLLRWYAWFCLPLSVSAHLICMCLVRSPVVTLRELPPHLFILIALYLHVPSPNSLVSLLLLFIDSSHSYPIFPTSKAMCSVWQKKKNQISQQSKMCDVVRVFVCMHLNPSPIWVWLTGLAHLSQSTRTHKHWQWAKILQRVHLQYQAAENSTQTCKNKRTHTYWVDSCMIGPTETADGWCPSAQWPSDLYVQTWVPPDLPALTMNTHTHICKHENVLERGHAEHCHTARPC